MKQDRKKNSHTFIKSKLTNEFNRRKEHSKPTENPDKAFKTHKRFTYTDYKNEENYCLHHRMRNHSNSECGTLEIKQVKQNYKQNNKGNFSSSPVFQKGENYFRNADKSNSDQNTAYLEHGKITG